MAVCTLVEFKSELGTTTMDDVFLQSKLDEAQSLVELEGVSIDHKFFSFLHKYRAMDLVFSYNINQKIGRGEGVTKSASLGPLSVSKDFGQSTSNNSSGKSVVSYYEKYLDLLFKIRGINRLV